MKKRISSTLACLISMVAVSFVTFTVSSTVAAFMILEQHKQTININMDYGKYFAAGSGTYDEATGTTKYIISDSDDLRNLSYLVSLGVFNKYDVFELNTSFDFDSLNGTKPLIPIGNIYNPFCSTFDGKDFYISNLEVEGKDMADVGMFGFVSADGCIKNFGLNNPTVTQIRTKPGTYTYIDKDNNPLRASNTITEDMCRAFDLEGVTYFQKEKENFGLTEFNIKYQTRAEDGTVTPGPSLPPGFKIMCQISDHASNLDPNTNTYLTVTDTSDQNQSSFNFKVKNFLVEKNKYVVAEFYVTGVASVDGENRFVKMTLEKYKLYCENDGSNNCYVICSKDDPKIFKKTIFPAIDKQDLTDTIVSYDHIEHTLNLGIVAGCVEGIADRIMVYNPHLISNGGPFQSKSYLIGRQIDDDNKSPISKYNIDFNDLQGNAQYSYVTNLNKNTYKDISDKNSGEVVLTNVYSDAQQSNKLIELNSIDTIRVYGTGAPSKPKKLPNKFKDDIYAHLYEYDAYSDNVALNKIQQKVTYRSYKDLESNPLKAVSFTDDVKGRVKIVPPWLPIGGDDIPSMRADNGISFWATAKDNTTPIARIFKLGKGTFYLNVTLKYLYFDNELTNMSNETDFSSKRIQVLAAKKNHDNAVAENGKTYARPASYENVPDGLYRCPANAWWALDEIATPDYPGDPQNVSSSPIGRVQLLEGKDPTKFYKSDISGTMADRDNQSKTFEPKYKTITLNSQVDTSGGGFGNTTTYTPVFLFGMNSKEASDKNYDLSILGMVVTISNINGNSSATLLDVDFATGKSMAIPNKDNFNHSRVKLQTSMFVTTGEIAKTNPIPPLSVATEAQSGNGIYKIDVTRSSNNVTVNYWCPSGINANQNLRPISVDGFTIVKPSYKGELTA